MAETSDELLEQVALIVSSFVQHNNLASAELPALIGNVFATLDRLAKGGSAADAQAPTPAVDPKRSVKSDHIICLEDGKKFKSLKRHLGVHHGMTPDEYRQKWGLPRDYPMVAPDYASTRSELAKSMGLGRKGRGRKRR
jgi:predicted transcriptional regulator